MNEPRDMSLELSLWGLFFMFIGLFCEHFIKWLKKRNKEGGQK